MLDNIRISFRGIFSHKLRSFLTMLGVIIGIASIIIIVSIVEGTKKNLETSLVGSGNNVTTVSLGLQDGGWMDPSQLSGSGIRRPSESEIKALVDIDGVEAASIFATKEIYDNSFWGNQPLTYSTAVGIADNGLDTFNYSLVYGRDFSALEYELGAKTLIINTELMKSSFDNKNPVGEIVEINNVPFVIVGVVAEANKTVEDDEYENLNDYYMSQYSMSGKLIVPLNAWPSLYAFDEPVSVALRVAETRQMASVGKKAADMLNETLQDPTYKYVSDNTMDDNEELEMITNAIQLILVSIASLSLLVGGIGVMNIMLVSVTERTSEIGLKKALGAKQKNIRLQFLTEAVVLTGTGGLLGIVFGLTIAKIITYVVDLQFGVNILWIVISVAFSMLVGVIFGAMPARRAARLDPIEALRRE